MFDGKRLKLIRNKTSFTQRGFADFLGISYNSYQSYEVGKRQPSIEVLIKIADILCVSTDYLLGRDEEDHHEKYLLQFESVLLTDAPKGFEEQYKIFKEINGLSVDMLIKEMGTREKYKQLESKT